MPRNTVRVKGNKTRNLLRWVDAVMRENVRCWFNILRNLCAACKITLFWTQSALRRRIKQRREHKLKSLAYQWNRLTLKFFFIRSCCHVIQCHNYISKCFDSDYSSRIAHFYRDFCFYFSNIYSLTLKLTMKSYRSISKLEISTNDTT